MAKAIDELYEIVRGQQKELERERQKSLRAQSHAYELLMKDNPITPDQLKADNVYLREELKRVIEQRDRLKMEHSDLKIQAEKLKQKVNVFLQAERKFQKEESDGQGSGLPPRTEGERNTEE